MLTAILWPDDSYLAVDLIQLDANRLHVTTHGTQTSAQCPSCQAESTRVNGYYCRRPADLPCLGYMTQLNLTVPRFFCDNEQCPRRTFAALLPAFIAPYARRTDRLVEEQRQIGFALSAEHGARLLPRLGSIASPDTLLRLVRQTPELEPATPRVLGVDDWARHKGQTYGTILVDLEQNQVVDLLADRSAATLTQWLAAHPGVEIISRDRASEYATGAAQGAPAAIQIADRFHLLQNLVAVLKRLLAECPAKLREVAQAVAAELQQQQHDKMNPPSGKAASGEEATTNPVAVESQIVVQSAPTAATSKVVGEAQSCAQPTLRELCFTEVKALQAQGLSQRTIARQLGLNRRTVSNYFIAEACPQRSPPPPPPSSVTPYLSYLMQRWQAGCHAITQLHAELEVLGFKGHYASVYRLVQRLLADGRMTQSPVATPIAVPNLSVTEAAWLLLHPTDRLDSTQLRLREQLCRASDDVNRAFALAQSFAAMVRNRLVEQLDPWLSDASQCQIKAFVNFAASLRRDYDAVKAALTYKWSNGQVEGQVNRLKLVKRLMYGRGKLDLLRRRVMGVPSPS